MKTHINMIIFRQRNDEIWQVKLLSVVAIQSVHLSHAFKVQDFYANNEHSLYSCVKYRLFKATLNVDELGLHIRVAFS